MCQRPHNKHKYPYVFRYYCKSAIVNRNASGWFGRVRIFGRVNGQTATAAAACPSFIRCTRERRAPMRANGEMVVLRLRQQRRSRSRARRIVRLAGWRGRGGVVCIVIGLGLYLLNWLGWAGNSDAAYTQRHARAASAVGARMSACTAIIQCDIIEIVEANVPASATRRVQLETGHSQAAVVPVIGSYYVCS